MLRGGHASSFIAQSSQRNSHLADKEAEIAKLKAQLAALTSTVDEMRDLLQDRANAVPNFNGTLLEAAAKGNTKQMRFALKGGANIKTRNEGGQSVLHLAIQNHHRDTTEFLLKDYPFLMATKDDKGHTALQQAAKIDPLEEFVWLYNKVKAMSEFVENQEGFEALYAVATEETRLFLVNNRFLESAGAGKLEAIQDAIAKGVNLNVKSKEGETALHKAVSSERQDIVTFLLTQGVDPTLRNNKNQEKISREHKTPLEIAIDKNNNELINAIATPFLIYAAQSGNQEDVLFALKAGAWLQGVDAKGQMALHKAVITSNLDIIELLLQQHAEKKVDIYRSDTAGNTPFDLAIQLGKTVITTTLVEGDLNRDCNKKLAIFLAEKFGEYKYIVKEREKERVKEQQAKLSQTSTSFINSIGHATALPAESAINNAQEAVHIEVTSNLVTRAC